MPEDETKPLTTTKAGELLGVSNRTVINLFERGLLKGYRIPGSSHRRFTRKDVIQFAKLNGIPINDDQ